MRRVQAVARLGRAALAAARELLVEARVEHVLLLLVLGLAAQEERAAHLDAVGDLARLDLLGLHQRGNVLRGVGNFLSL